MSDVFISYARSTAGQAHAVAEALRALGYDVWRDDQLPAHRAYTDVIEERLQSAKAVVVIWSAEAVKSHWVRSEADRARSDDKLVQLLVDGSRLPMPFDQIQCADLRGWNGDDAAPGWRKVVGSVQDLVKGIKTPAAAPSARPNFEAAAVTNLPRPASALIGREQALAEIAELMGRHRLVSLTGHGGAGKTRLAVEAGHALLTGRADGVWFVDLAAIADGSLVASTAATSLRAQLSPNVSPLDGVVAQLRTSDALLILDNCEHVIEAAAELAQRLLSQTERVLLLVTSREPLGVEGEHVLMVPPLALPDPGATTAEAVLKASAAQLFVDLAKSADRTFSLTERAAPTVGMICRRLDGVPLAIAMAAALAPTLGAENLAKLLDQRFRLLTGGKRTALPRHQTLLATLDWSFDLLCDRDKTVLRRVATFTGGFTLDAASVVASDEALDEFDVIDAVASLTAKSLVVIQNLDRGPRYRLLETTGFYALEKLTEAGEQAAFARRHEDYFRSLFEVAPIDHWRLTDSEFLDRYAPELDNLRLAIDRAFAGDGDVETGLALVGSAVGLWTRLGLQPEGLRRTELALTRVSADTPPRTVAALWHACAQCFPSGAPDKILAAAERAVASCRPLGDDLMLAAALERLVASLTMLGRFEEVAQLLAELTALADRVDSKRLTAVSLFRVGTYLRGVGEAPKALEVYATATKLAREAGADSMALIAAINTVDCRWSALDLDGALDGAREVVAQQRRARFLSSRDRAVGLGNLFGILVERGDLGEAGGLAREAASLRKEDGAGWAVIDWHALFAAKRGEVRTAAKLLGYVGAALAAMNSMGQEPNEARAHQAAMALVRESLREGEIAALCTEGARLTDAEACELAMSA